MASCSDTYYFPKTYVHVRALKEIPSGRAQRASSKHNDGKEASKQCGAAQYISTAARAHRGETGTRHSGDFRFLPKCTGFLCLACGPVCTYCKHTNAGTTGVFGFLMAREDVQPVSLLLKKYEAVYVLLVSKDDKHNMTSSTVCLLEDQGSKDKSQNVSGIQHGMSCNYFLQGSKRFQKKKGTFPYSDSQLV